MSTIAEDLERALGPDAVLTNQEGMRPYLIEWRGNFASQAAAVVRPASTEAVAAAVRVCAARRIGIVPMGGNTGLVGGAVAMPGQVIVATERLNRIRTVDPEGYTITTEAGVILQRLQDAAATVDRLFPLSLGAEGSCRIGGNLATNAGGTAVLRYGSARDLVLGLEVVLPDGRIWNGLKSLRKDNTGYALAPLFVGSEGTLGIITAAVLKLFPRPRAISTAFVAVSSIGDALKLFRSFKDRAGDRVSAFEFMPANGCDMAVRHIPGAVLPLPTVASWYLLIECTSGEDGSALDDLTTAVLAAAAESGEVLDAAIATSHAQAQAFWRLREGLVDSQRKGASAKHDVTLPLARLERFIVEAARAVEAIVPGARTIPFGHLGDGNVHFNVLQPTDWKADAFRAEAARITQVVYDIVMTEGGSFSAEHGIGLSKRDELAARADPVGLDLMKNIKKAFDPLEIMNPGKVI